MLTWSWWANYGRSWAPSNHSLNTSNHGWSTGYVQSRDLQAFTDLQKWRLQNNLVRGIWLRKWLTCSTCWSLILKVVSLSPFDFESWMTPHGLWFNCDTVDLRTTFKWASTQWKEELTRLNSKKKPLREFGTQNTKTYLQNRKL